MLAVLINAHRKAGTPAVDPDTLNPYARADLERAMPRVGVGVLAALVDVPPVSRG